MAKAEWGTKRICPSCGTRYYDMKKLPPVCPNCGTHYDPEALLRSRRRSVQEEKKKSPEALEETAVMDLEVPAADAEVEAAVIEDAEELGEGEIEDVVEVEDEDQS